MRKLFLLCAIVSALFLRGYSQEPAPNTQTKIEKTNGTTTVVAAPKASEVVVPTQVIVEEATPKTGPKDSVYVTGLPAPSTWTAKDLFGQLFDPIYGFLFTLLSYLSYLIPGINGIKDTLTRVVTIAVILAIGFIMFGFADFWQVAVSFLISSGFYKFFLQAFIKTKDLKAPDITPTA